MSHYNAYNIIQVYTRVFQWTCTNHTVAACLQKDVDCQLLTRLSTKDLYEGREGGDGEVKVLTCTIACVQKLLRDSYFIWKAIRKV